MAKLKPKTKAVKAEQLTGELRGELGTYITIGIFQRALAKKSIYRYRGALLQYQKSLDGQEPTLQTSKLFLGHLRENGFGPNTLKIYRSALRGFHEWRGEDLKFEVKIPHRQPKYIEAKKVDAVLNLAKGNPTDSAMLCLMSEAGLRRAEIVNLKVSDIGDTAIRFKGKGGRERTIPMSANLNSLLKPLCAGKHSSAKVLGVSSKAVYYRVKRYGRLAGLPEFKPHDLRHAFAERLVEGGANLRAVQELLGHSSLAITEIYVGVTGNHLREAISVLNKNRKGITPPEKHLMSWELPDYMLIADLHRRAEGWSTV